MLNKSIHKRYLINIIKEIFSSKISDLIAFKGGTLAYFFHDLDRFSTDIDLDLLDVAQEKKVIDVFENKLQDLGEIKSKMLGNNLHRWIFRYDQQSHNIKVELNKRIWSNNSYKIVNFFGIDVKVMDEPSMFTNKLVALSERFANRDLYDVYFFAKKGFGLNEDLIKERTGKDKSQLIEELVKKIPKKYNSRSILFQMGELVDNKQKNRIKKHLLDETLFYLRSLA